MWGKLELLAAALLGADRLQLQLCSCKPNRAGISWYLTTDKVCPSGIHCGLAGLGLVN